MLAVALPTNITPRNHSLSDLAHRTVQPLVHTVSRRALDPRSTIPGGRVLLVRRMGLTHRGMVRRITGCQISLQG